jgi:hypothetical protein
VILSNGDGQSGPGKAKAVVQFSKKGMGPSPSQESRGGVLPNVLGCMPAVARC